jgi:hypothetical protein
MFGWQLIRVQTYQKIHKSPMKTILSALTANENELYQAEYK